MRVRFLCEPERCFNISSVSLLSLFPSSRPVLLNLHGEEYDYATSNFSFTLHFSSFELWSSCLDHSELCIMSFDIPTITFEASVAMCQLCQLNPARDLLCFHGNLILFFNRRVWPRIAWDDQVHAILKTLLSQVVTGCPVVTASRCEVSRHVATFVSWVKSVR